nr:MAG TPA: hypothetical protein [Caudoviricetes sp.]
MRTIFWIFSSFFIPISSKFFLVSILILQHYIIVQFVFYD